MLYLHIQCVGFANKISAVSYFSLPGSNTGIGKTTAIDLAKRGARVILACRSKQRGEAALEEVKMVRINSIVLC